MTDDRRVALAKHGPVGAVVLALLLGIVMYALTALGVFPENAMQTLLPLAMAPLGLALLFQGTFIVTHPQTAIEESIEPPSKYDTSFQTKSGAWKMGGLACLGGVFAIGISVFYGLVVL